MGENSIEQVGAVWGFMALPDFHSNILIEAVIGFKERGQRPYLSVGRVQPCLQTITRVKNGFCSTVCVILWGLAPVLSAHHSLTNCVLCFKAPGILATYNSLSILICLALLDSFLCLEWFFSLFLHLTNSYFHTSLRLSAFFCRSPSMNVSLG